MTFASDTYLRNGVNIQVFIDNMQRNFILTDVMKTGDHPELEQFINSNTFTNQTFDMTGEYYMLHQYDLDSFDRKFAIIDWKAQNKKLKDNPEFMKELQNRCNLLHSQGFVFIKANPWESLHNIKYGEQYPDIDVEHIKWSGGVSYFWCYMFHKHKNKRHEFHHDNKKFDFLYLNKFAREHRKTLFASVEPLLEGSLYTNWDKGIKLPPEYELPWAQQYPIYGKDQDIYEKPYNDTKYSLVSETNDTNDEIFMTEKIWKAIIAKHIFVVHGNFLYLQKLREMGFRTFVNYFNEDYDLEQDKAKRIDKIVGTCREILKKNWKDLYLQSQALRQHNYDTFFNADKLGVQVNKTLELFFEFADSRQVSS